MWHEGQGRACGRREGGREERAGGAGSQASSAAQPTLPHSHFTPHAPSHVVEHRLDAAVAQGACLVLGNQRRQVLECHHREVACAGGAADVLHTHSLAEHDGVAFDVGVHLELVHQLVTVPFGGAAELLHAALLRDPSRTPPPPTAHAGGGGHRPVRRPSQSLPDAREILRGEILRLALVFAVPEGKRH